MACLVALSVPGTASAANCAETTAPVPQGLGLFMTDTQQARWQLDNINNPSWLGNHHNPPPCFGPNCTMPFGIPTKPLSTLQDVVTSMNTTIMPDFLVVKIADDYKVVPQVMSPDFVAFNDLQTSLYGYHKFGPGDPALQAEAIRQAFTLQPRLEGLVIMPGDSLYRPFDTGAATCDRDIETSVTPYVRMLQDLKTSGALVNKAIIYAPEAGDVPERLCVHEAFVSIADAVMPRTFWGKRTEYGPITGTPAPGDHDTTHPVYGKLYEAEKRFRKTWSRNNTGPQWWDEKCLLLLAQTDMMSHRETGPGNKPPKTRIREYVRRVRQAAGGGVGIPNRPYPHFKGIGIWEFAHMNRSEIDEISNRAW